MKRRVIISSSLFALALLGGSGKAAEVSATDGAWWLNARAACPQGTRLHGAAPPLGVEVGCAQPSGVWDGPWAQWYQECEPSPCSNSGPNRRVQGVYRRGIAHGFWTWWRKDGSKGLEGMYNAGRKSGVWYSWDAAGNRRATEFESYSTKAEVVDAAILEALGSSGAATASASLELEAASNGLKQTRTQRDQLQSRGHDSGPGASVGVARMGPSSNLDLPNEDLGRTEFAEGGTTEVTPYTRAAIRKAAKRMRRCYRRARLEQPNLAGALTARFLIRSDGHVIDVRVVQSSLTETMNQCVKKSLRGMRLARHSSQVPVEVISPWSFVPPRR